jgi:hypothetical protein
MTMPLADATATRPDHVPGGGCRVVAECPPAPFGTYRITRQPQAAHPTLALRVAHRRVAGPLDENRGGAGGWGDDRSGDNRMRRGQRQKH